MSDDYLVVFRLNGQRYALPIINVSEIIRVMDLTKVPEMHFYYRGIINLRGSTVPVMSLGLRLGLDEGELDKDSRIIVAELNGSNFGLIVDRVNFVMKFSEDKASKPDRRENQFVRGIVQQGDEKILILDIDRIIN